MSALARLAIGDGVEIAYREEGSGDPLLLIHGIAEDHRAWDELAALLVPHARVIRVDLPGHGESSGMLEYSAGQFTQAVARFVQAADLGRPHVVGHSLGGIVATLLGAFTPVRSVVNVDQTLRLAPFLDHIRQLAPRLAGAGFVEALREELEARGGAQLTERLRRDIRAYCVPEHRPAVLGLWLPLAEQTEARALQMLAPLFARVRSPYLSLHGSDPGPGYEAWLRAHIPTARVETWDGHGYWLHRTAPERVAARLRAFHAESEGDVG